MDRSENFSVEEDDRNPSLPMTCSKLGQSSGSAMRRSGFDSLHHVSKDEKGDPEEGKQLRPLQESVFLLSS